MDLEQYFIIYLNHFALKVSWICTKDWVYLPKSIFLLSPFSQASSWVPSLVRRAYLYSIKVPFLIFSEYFQWWPWHQFILALNSVQLPNSGMLPTMNTISPVTVYLWQVKLICCMPSARSLISTFPSSSEQSEWAPPFSGDFSSLKELDVAEAEGVFSHSFGLFWDIEYLMGDFIFGD